MYNHLKQIEKLEKKQSKALVEHIDDNGNLIKPEHQKFELLCVDMVEHSGSCLVLECV